MEKKIWYKMRLSLIDYMHYLGATNTSRCIYEGEEVLNAGHVILCGKLNTSTCSVIMLCALCLQTSALTSDPHEISGKLAIKEEKVQVEEMQCSCKAGRSGKCKHISAVLIKCTRENLLELEVVAQTDLKCVWSRQKNVTRQKYQAVPIKDMPCFNDCEINVDMDVDDDAIMDFFIEKLPDSAIAKHRVGRRSSIATTTDVVLVERDDFATILNHASQSVVMMELCSFYVKNDKNCCKIILDAFDQDLPETSIVVFQQSKEWHDLRKFCVTGSRVYELYTYSKKDWETKSIKYFHPKTFTNKFVKHGIKFESEARDVFISKTGFSVIECGMLISHSNPWLGYSPDGVVLALGQPVALIEIKCLYEGASTTVTEAIKNAKFMQNINGTYQLKTKHKYFGQIQLGMSLFNVPKCFFIIYASFDKSLVIVEINFDYDFSKRMLSVVKQNFFEKMVHVICNYK